MLIDRLRDIRSGVVQRTKASRSDGRVAAGWDRSSGSQSLSRDEVRRLEEGSFGLQMVGVSHRLHSTKVCGGRDDADVAVEDPRKTVGLGANNIVRALLVAVDTVLRIEHAGSLLDSDLEGDGRSAILALNSCGIDSMFEEPCVHQRNCLGMRCHERFHLFLRQMLAVPINKGFNEVIVNTISRRYPPRVGGVANFIQCGHKIVETILLESDAHVECMISRSSRVKLPAPWNLVPCVLHVELFPSLREERLGSDEVSESEEESSRRGEPAHLE